MSRREKIILALVGLTLLFLFVNGVLKMYFHQDDVDFLIGVSRDWPTIIWRPVNEHVVTLFWLLYRTEWLLFGTNFTGYLLFSIILHTANLFLAGKIVYEETKSRFFGFLTALFPVVNNNWNESIWWSTGQMWLLATAFCLVFLLQRKWLDKNKGVGSMIWLITLLILPGLSWGIGLFWPVMVFVGFGFVRKDNKVKVTKIGFLAVAAQLILIAVYKLISGSTVKLVSFISLTRLWQMAVFVVVGLANTVVGRLLFPWENKPIRVVVLAVVMLLIVSRWRLILAKVRFFEGFLFFCVLAFFSTYALGRASFGVGQAMATRYAYLPTFFLVMGAMTLISRFMTHKPERFLLLFGTYCLISGLIVFNWRTSEWTKRPQLTKQYFTLIKQTGIDNCYVNEQLPKFINPEPTKRLSDLIFPLRVNLKFGTAEQHCVLLSP